MKKIMTTSIFIYLLTVCAAWSAQFGETDINGFISQGYLQSNHNNYLANTEDGSFQFNEMGINFNHKISNRFKVGIQFLARDLGNVGNDEIEIDWAFADYRWKNWLGLRVGTLKTPRGLYNETRDIDMLRTSILLPDSLYYEGARDSFIRTKGLSLYGTIPMNHIGMFTYKILYGTTQVDTESGTGLYLQDSISQAFPPILTLQLTDINIDHTQSMEIQWYTPIEGLRIASSIADMQYDIYYSVLDINNNVIMSDVSPIDMFRVNTCSIEYTWNNLVLSSEYIYSTVETKGNPSVKFNSEGYYANISYRLYRWFEFGLSYSEFFPDTDDKDGDNLAIDYRAWQKDFTSTLRFDVNEYWTAKLEIHNINGTALLLQSENKDNEMKKNWILYAAKLSYAF